MRSFTLFALILIIVIVPSCQKEELVISEEEPTILETYFPDKTGMMILGEELEDPYKLSNMIQALENLSTSTNLYKGSELRATHLYLKFAPKNNKEWDIVKADSTVPVYDFPLHYEILNEGATFYHDPELPKTRITYQYMVLPINKEIPDVEHEILYKVFLPKAGSLAKSTQFDSKFLRLLEDEAHRVAGINVDALRLEKGTKGTSGYHPQGSIHVFDDIMEYPSGTNIPVPLVGAQVHARWFTHTDLDLTDADGDFYMSDDFKYDVNYSVKWERAGYNIRDGLLTQAWYNGPKKDTPWYLTIGFGGKSIMYATIHRSAYVQFYGDNQGIDRPHGGSNKVNICYMDTDGNALGMYWTIGGGILPDIQIWGKYSSGSYRPTWSVFATTAHELGHLVHYNFMGTIQGWQIEDIIIESWAESVEWCITVAEYVNLGDQFSVSDAQNFDEIYGNQGQQWWDVYESTPYWYYSPLFIDLIDDYNQMVGGQYGQVWDFDRPNDDVTGFTLDYIFDNILRDSYGRSTLRDEIKANKVSGVTDTQIDNLFDLYW